MAATEITVDRKFDVRRTASVDAVNGVAYPRDGYSFLCSPNLVRTGFPHGAANFYDSAVILAEMIKQGRLPADARFMLQPEGYQIEQSYQGQHKDPIRAEEFQNYFAINDYFAINNNRWYGVEWTASGLRVPEGWENGRVDKGTGKYPRQIIETDISKAVELLIEGAMWEDIGDSINRIVGERHFPIGDGMAIIESNDFDGLPVVTRNIRRHYKGCYSHWWLDLNPQRDKISGHYDVAVVRRSAWPLDGHYQCLSVRTDGRHLSTRSGGFRPVRGPLPEIKKVLARINPEDA